MARGFSVLAALKKQTAEIKLLAREIAARSAERILAEVRKEFAESRDPYGNAWRGFSASTMRKIHPSHPYRVASGALEESIDAIAVGEVIRVRADVSAAREVRFQLTTHGAAVLPRKGEVPPAWKAIIQEEAEAAFRDALGGGGV